MASLKEIKGRISSIQGTLKITSAMKMVASAKLHKAQAAIEGMLPYERGLSGILSRFLSGGLGVQSPFAVPNKGAKVAVVAFSSNSSLCGGFNSNVARLLGERLEACSREVGKDNVLVYPVGRKVAEAVRKWGYVAAGDFQHLSGKPGYPESAQLAEQLMDVYLRGEVRRVELIYHHFKSTSTQELRTETYLPIDFSACCEAGAAAAVPGDYLVEPSPAAVVRSLLPKVLRLRIYTVALDSSASEHAARTMAMQVATDNANELIQDLTLLYNKSRQQAITNELLDIVGGTMA